MEKNYKIVVRERKTSTTKETMERQDLGQAIIAVKYYGNNLWQEDQQPHRYYFIITNKSQKIEDDEIEEVTGVYSICGNPIIKEIVTHYKT